jgi:hypothetical protein
MKKITDRTTRPLTDNVIQPLPLIHPAIRVKIEECSPSYAVVETKSRVVVQLFRVLLVCPSAHTSSQRLRVLPCMALLRAGGARLS